MKEGQDREMRREFVAHQLLCVGIKVRPDDLFMITACFADTVKKSPALVQLGGSPLQIPPVWATGRLPIHKRLRTAVKVVRDFRACAPLMRAWALGNESLSKIADRLGFKNRGGLDMFRPGYFFA